jgi:hypothetical protein
MPNRVHLPFPLLVELPERLEFVSINFDFLGYRVKVAEFARPDGLVYEIDFGKMPLAQRSMDEGKFLAMTAHTSYSAREIGSIVLVTGSDFLDWFHLQSCGMYPKDEVKHVAILTQNEWVEVLCLELPQIYLLSSEI